jgi:multiple antibiotic resistance protein
MNVDLLINAFVTIIVMFDPPGLAAIFLGLTTGMTRSQRLQVACAERSPAAGILAVFAIAGAGILGILGISLGAFRIAGGIAAVLDRLRDDFRKTP